MIQTEKPLYIEDFVFGFWRDHLKDASPDDICSYYVQNLIFKNTGFLEYITAKYQMPSDFLKFHKKVIQIATQKEIREE